MITFKGSPLVKGKHFIYENKQLEYEGKVFGTHHSFKDENDTQYLFTENDVGELKPYQVLQEHSLIEEQENSDELYQVITSYTDKELKLIEKEPDNLKSLLDLLQEEVNTLQSLGLSYNTSFKKINGDKEYLLTVITDFLKGTQRNISDTSLPNLYVQLNNFIYNLTNILKEV